MDKMHNIENTGAVSQAPSSFDDMLAGSFERLEEKQAAFFLRRISEMEKTLRELEECLISALQAHDRGSLQ
jgi:hypothetical protein